MTRLFQNYLRGLVRSDYEFQAKEMKELKASWNKMAEMLNKMRTEKTTAEQKVKAADMKLEQNKSENIELRRKLDIKQLKVNNNSHFIVTN